MKYKKDRDQTSQVEHPNCTSDNPINNEISEPTNEFTNSELEQLSSYKGALNTYSSIQHHSVNPSVFSCIDRENDSSIFANIKPEGALEVNSLLLETNPISYSVMHSLRDGLHHNLDSIRLNENHISTYSNTHNSGIINFLNHETDSIYSAAIHSQRDGLQNNLSSFNVDAHPISTFTDIENSGIIKFLDHETDSIYSATMHAHEDGLQNNLGSIGLNENHISTYSNTHNSGIINFLNHETDSIYSAAIHSQSIRFKSTTKKKQMVNTIANTLDRLHANRYLDRSSFSVELTGYTVNFNIYISGDVRGNNFNFINENKSW